MQSIKGMNDPKWRSKRMGMFLLYVFIAVCFGSGVYMLVLVLTPQVIMSPTVAVWNEPVNYEPQKINQDRLYIPKLKLNITYKAGGPEVLSNNAWHRYSERGDPAKGGNFIVAAHRFEVGLTPGETKRKSPFYYLDALETGDKIYADYGGKRYEYEVIRRFSVKPTALEIEGSSTEPIMTLYTCTLKGEQDGREVIIAKRVGVDIDLAKKF